MHAERDIALASLSVRLSVKQSHSDIVSKRKHMSSNSVHNLVEA